jgi:hypothetical protein
MIANYNSGNYSEISDVTHVTYTVCITALMHRIRNAVNFLRYKALPVFKLNHLNRVNYYISSFIDA